MAGDDPGAGIHQNRIEETERYGACRDLCIWASECVRGFLM
jgi:hypothetical protein